MRPDKAVAAKSSVAATANAKGPFWMLPETSAVSAYDRNHLGFTSYAIFPRPITGSLPSPKKISENLYLSPMKASICSGSQPQKIAELRSEEHKSELQSLRHLV